MGEPIEIKPRHIERELLTKQPTHARSPSAGLFTSLQENKTIALLVIIIIITLIILAYFMSKNEDDPTPPTKITVGSGPPAERRAPQSTTPATVSTTPATVSTTPATISIATPFVQPAAEPFVSTNITTPTTSIDIITACPTEPIPSPQPEGPPPTPVELDPQPYSICGATLNNNKRCKNKVKPGFHCSKHPLPQ